MTRNEQINQITEQKYPFDEYSLDNFSKDMRNEFIKLFRKCFEEGVKWADSNPKEGLQSERRIG